jgi:hypothetical protein
MKLSIFKNLLLTFSTFLILILLSEFALRFFYKPLKSGWGWQDSPRRSLASSEYDHQNELGLRGQNISYNTDDYIILLVGNSQVEAATSSPHNMPEYFLQSILNTKLAQNVNVFSIAASGWGQDQQLLSLKEYYKYYKADLVLIWATPKNDFWENTFPDRGVTKVAGHIKPTYRLDGDKISGPFFELNTYYKNSVLLQLFYSAIQSINGETIEQHILRNWMDNLPSPHNPADYTLEQSNHSPKEIDLKVFSQNLSIYSMEDSLTILTNEDFLNSRSHFSPFGERLSSRDNYLINITRKLFERMKDLTNSYNSNMFVFYPAREDYDVIYRKCIRYIKMKYLPNVGVPIKLDYFSMLQRIIPKDKLLELIISGGNELSVSCKDRHLSDIGNEIIMNQVADFILEHFKTELNNKSVIKI